MMRLGACCARLSDLGASEGKGPMTGMPSKNANMAERRASLPVMSSVPIQLRGASCSLIQGVPLRALWRPGSRRSSPSPGEGRLPAVRRSSGFG